MYEIRTTKPKTNKPNLNNIIEAEYMNWLFSNASIPESKCKVKYNEIKRKYEAV